MGDKTTHFGRAGEFFAMSELLLRGWNVAVPAVDVGDDVFVVDDNDKTTYRLQVKTAKGVGGKFAFALSRQQLRALQQIELFYMLLMREDARWRFLVIPRDELVAVRDRFEQPADGARPRGAPAKKDADAKTDAMALNVEFDGTSALAWGDNFDTYLDRWPSALPVIQGGPGTRGQSIAR